MSFMDKMWLFNLYHPFLVNYYGIFVEQINNPKEGSPFLSVLVFMDYFHYTWECDTPKIRRAQNRDGNSLNLLNHMYRLTTVLRSMELTGIWVNNLTPASVMLTKDNKVRLFLPIFGNFVSRSELFTLHYPEYMNPKLAGEKCNTPEEFHFRELQQPEAEKKDSRKPFCYNGPWSLLLFLLEALSER